MKRYMQPSTATKIMALSANPADSAREQLFSSSMLGCDTVFLRVLSEAGGETSFRFGGLTRAVVNHLSVHWNLNLNFMQMHTEEAQIPADEIRSSSP
jgi:hypothetical protein